MIEIIFLIVAVGSIYIVAGQRGGKGVLWALIALGGYFGLKYGMRWLNLFPLPPGSEAEINFVRFFVAFGFVLLIYLIVRFGLGRSKPKAGGKWVCPDCKFLNDEIATNCEACGRAYREPD